MTELFENQDTDPGPENAERSDQQIQKDIQQLYAGEVYLKDRGIRVTVEDCVVTLEGTVFTQQSWQLASDLAADVRGVSEIRNHIQVQPGPGNPQT